MRKNQSGFTLVEIAIVLVIIGLLLGGVLKGQELINSAKAKSVVNDFRNVTTMIAAYQDRFRALPGDHAGVVNALPGATAAAAAGRGNGAIDGAWNAAPGNDESILMWQHLRLANLATGSTANPVGMAQADFDDNWAPRNSEGGRIGITSRANAAAWVGAITGRHLICQGNIDGRIAEQVDRTMDDGNPNTGSVGVWTTANPPAAIAVPQGGGIARPVEGTNYIVCYGF